MDFLEDLYKSIDDWNIEYNNLESEIESLSIYYNKKNLNLSSSDIARTIKLLEHLY
ncbi:TPA: hypothetical protein O4E67_002867, partial [Staphylococcus aureus]|nr:hypothetical protein [Staphylococcus aureus]